MRPNATTVTSGVAARPQHGRGIGLCRLHELVAGRQRRIGAFAIEQLVLDDQRRLDAAAKRAIQRRDRRAAVQHEHSQARHADEMLLEVLAVRRAVTAAAAHRRADDDRARHAAVVHAAKLRRVIQELVEAERQEVAEHDLDDRPSPAEREPVRDTDDAGLADRRVQHAVGMVVRQAARRLERAAVRRADVLAEQQCTRVLGEPVAQRSVDGRKLRAGAPATAAATTATAAPRAPFEPRREVEHGRLRGPLDRARDALADRRKLRLVGAVLVRQELIQRIAALVLDRFPAGRDRRRLSSAPRGDRCRRARKPGGSRASPSRRRCEAEP